MARLMSQVKMGYYPTPKEVLIDIASKFELKSGLGCNILDPCCGEGDALEILKKNIKGGELIRTYGIELDRNRYLKAKKKVDRILNADALNEVAIEDEKFSLLFLNPPYDDGESEGEYDERKRLEVSFLEAYTSMLYSSSYYDNGKAYLVYVIPFSSLKYAYRYIEKHYRYIHVEPFPMDLYKQFKQVVVYAVYDKDKSIYDYDTNEIEEKIGKLKATNPDDYDEVETILKEHFSLNFNDAKLLLKGSDPVKVFKKINIRPEDMYNIVRETNLIKKVFKKYEKKDITMKITPLTNLRKGHLAMLIAAGYLNGDIEKNGERYTIKGVINKQDISDEEEVYNDRDETVEKKTVTVTRYDININVYDYQRNEFYVVK